MRAGDVIAERFELERLAATGGMGSVYRAMDRHTGAVVALKLLHAKSPEVAERFEREARILADLRHPGIVAYLAHGKTSGQQLYLAIEWLEGEDLSTRLKGAGLTIPESLSLVRRAGEAIATAHRRSIVHRDLKPSNLFLVGGEVTRMKILDFGIARLGGHVETATRTGAMLGTPGYMSPEQVRGQSDLDASADVYALGCVLFECLTGRTPFIADHAIAMMAKILMEEPPRVADLRADIDARVDDLVARMLSKQPFDRPRTADDLVAEISSLMNATGAAPRRPSVRPSEIGSGEQRLLSVVLAPATRRVTPTVDRDAPTLGMEKTDLDLERLKSIAARFGARLEMLLDGSMVVTMVGTRAATDQAAQAARCALGLRMQVPDVPMALATGRGQVADVFPVGEAIDRAAAMLRLPAPEVAGPDVRPVRIDEVTAGLLDERFDFGSDAVGLVLRRERERPDGARRLLGKPTPYLGREREMGTLEAVWDECCDDAVARVALVTAPAGMGKSRLRHEFLRRVRESDRATEVWIGRADPMSAGSAFGILAPAIRRAAGIQDGEPRADARDKLTSRVVRHVLPREATRVTTFLGELIGVPFEDTDDVQLHAARQDATLMGDQMQRAWEDFVAAECKAHPVLMVLEDLQWGDLPTVKFVDTALRNLKDRSLMVLALARPDVHDLFPKLWDGRSITRITLGELTRRASERLVRDILGDIDHATLAEVVDRAAGNAFFLEELIRAVAEGRGASLPPTVLAMMQSRMQSIDPDARRLLRAASVFGRAFWRGSVLALLGGSGEATTRYGEWLPVLVDQELIEARPRARFPGEDEFTFRHSLVRDAAYSALTDADRVLGHRLAGSWLENTGETDAMVLAEHYDRGGEPARALAWFRRGAEQALEGHDFMAAIARAERGLSCGAEEEQRGALLSLEAEGHRWRGKYALTEARAAEASNLFRRGSAPWFRAIEEVMGACGRLANYPRALEWSREACAAEAEDGAKNAQVICLCAAARLRFHAGDYALAHEAIERIAQVAPDLGQLEPRAVAEVHRVRGASARHVGDVIGDLSGYEAALTAFEEAGDARNACNARVSLGFAFIQLGDFERAGDELERALISSERMGLHTISTRAKQNLGLVRAAAGDVASAMALERAAIEESRAQGNVRFEGWTRVYLSFIACAGGDVDTAEREARTAAEMLVGTPPARAGAQAALARALLAKGDAAEARAPAEEAMQLLESLGGIEEFEPLVRVSHAEVLHALGRKAEARAKIAVARDRVMAAARAISDQARRRSFLQRVPENVRILSRATAWLGDDADLDPPSPATRAAFDAEAFRAQGHAVIDRLADYLSAATQGEMPVVELPDPKTLIEQWSENFPEEPSGDLTGLLDGILRGAVHQHHPRYVGHQVTPPLPVAALSELSAALLNNGMASYEAGPVSTAMEHSVVRWMCRQLGFGKDADGVLTSGGSLGNLTAILAARQAKAGFDAWVEGATGGPPLSVLVADQAHYSVARAAHLMGWGRDGIELVPIDDRFRLRLDALEESLTRARSKGRRVIAVVASAGSTATGSIDGLGGVADFCAAHDLWMHVDGAHGASAMLCARYRSLLAGIERADSVTWDAHKLLGIPALATGVLFREGARSYETFAQSASYLFTSVDPREEWFNLGRRTLECTKGMMSAKVYAPLRLLGTRLFADHVARTFDLARAFGRMIVSKQELELAVEPECNIVCFRRRGDDALQEAIRDRIIRSGKFFLVKTTLAGRTWLRAVVMNPLTTEQDLAALLEAVLA